MMDFWQLAPEFQLTWWEWILIFLAGVIVGISKAGVKGLGVLVVTIFLIVFGGKTSTGIVVPLFIMGDIFAVWYYRRDAQWKYLFRLLPWMFLGVLLGVWVGQDLPEDLFRRSMAVIILLTVVMMYVWERRPIKNIPDNWWFAGIMGLAAGFTTMVGNLAGAFSNIFFLAMRFPKAEFIGTAAWLFFIINLFKLPFHIFVWETITPETLAVNLRLIPAIVIGLFLGVHFVKVIKEKHFRQLILVLTALGAILILVS